MQTFEFDFITISGKELSISDEISLYNLFLNSLIEQLLLLLFFESQDYRVPANESHIDIYEFPDLYFPALRCILVYIAKS